MHAGDGPSHLEQEVQSLRKQLADAQEQQRQQADGAQRHMDSAAALCGSQARLDGLQVQRLSSALLYLPYPFKGLELMPCQRICCLALQSNECFKCWPAGWLGSMQ